MAETTLWRAVGRLAPADPRHVAGFEVVGRLGRGGMGVVYLACHPEMGLAALKFVDRASAGDETFRARFRREVAAADRVRSPRVAPVLAADPEAEIPWLATAFVDGPTLHEAVSRGVPMHGEALIALGVALADALMAIHRANVVHRDLKPSNILLTAETPVVIDFGIASLREGPALTRPGSTLGTPGWMAPEQIRGGRTGPRVDVFAWGLVMAFAACGRPPFGEGQAEALCYRIVHEAPHVPPLPPPLDRLVPAALAKEPRRRPPVSALLDGLTTMATAVDTTAVDRTELVPTLVAQGWSAEVLPPPPVRPPGSDATLAPTRAAGPSFWFGGVEHDDPRSLAAALQASWDEATDQLFRRRDPVWLGELQTFLRARHLDEAERIVRAGAATDPVLGTMARLLMALDRGLEPRLGGMVLTPAGLTAAARAVLAGGGDGDRLAAVRDARILRLWRSLPGMEGAAAIDERWQAGSETFERLVGTVSAQLGWPTPDDRRRATASLLLCAVDPDHERDLARRLASARRSAAGDQSWWAQLAEEGRRSPAAAVLALMTSDRARSQAVGVRAAARQAARAQRQAQRRQRDLAKESRRQVNRYWPQRRHHPAVRSAWILAAALGSVLFHLWTQSAVGDRVALFYALDRRPLGPENKDTYDSVVGLGGLYVLLIVLLPAAHAAARAIAARGARRGVVRLYAVASAAVDLGLGVALIGAAVLAGLVLDVATESRDQGLPQLAPGWGAVLVQMPLGLVGIYLLVRSLWRLGRAVFSSSVGTGPVAPELRRVP